jgi:hypothetical protein
LEGLAEPETGGDHAGERELVRLGQPVGRVVDRGRGPAVPGQVQQRPAGAGGWPMTSVGYPSDSSMVGWPPYVRIASVAFGTDRTYPESDHAPVVAISHFD